MRHDEDEFDPGYYSGDPGPDEGPIYDCDLDHPPEGPTEPTQKYFIGNFVKHKTEGWYGVVCSRYCHEDGTNELFCIAKFDFSHGNTKRAWPAWLQYVSDEQGITDNFDIIPYPWQEFFKVGDKVQTEYDGIGKITDTTTNSGARLIFVHFGGENKDKYRILAPHELIKVGEA